MRWWVEQRGKETRYHDRVELAVKKHLVRLSIRRNMLHLIAFGRFNLPQRPRRQEVPLDLFELDVVFMLQNAAHPYRRRLLKLPQADAHAHQIFRLANAAFGIDKNVRMAEGPRRKNRNRGQRLSNRRGGVEDGHEDLRGLEAELFKHGRQNLRLGQKNSIESIPCRFI